MHRPVAKLLKHLANLLKEALGNDTARLPQTSSLSLPVPHDWRDKEQQHCFFEALLDALVTLLKQPWSPTKANICAVAANDAFSTSLSDAGMHMPAALRHALAAAARSKTDLQPDKVADVFGAVTHSNASKRQQSMLQPEDSGASQTCGAHRDPISLHESLEAAAMRSVPDLPCHESEQHQPPLGSSGPASSNGPGHSLRDCGLPWGPNGRRHSTRMPHPPLQYWRGERAIYARTKRSLATIEEYVTKPAITPMKPGR
ncbi:hypothetical protein WJX73_009823 [Symbiochloris irregularis]|uniref:Uncharacterized protein n=1 Tax=Symbiochloris irregularis TaxID=706552 RepID=A0AAW1P8Q5_9CHLO